MNNLILDEETPWKVIAFGDLHVSAKTLDRALDVLRRVRALAIQHRAEVVCLGDFWDQRGVLNVRQVDALMAEFDLWKACGVKAIFVPGNHDQVSVSGTIHGIRIFAPYSNFSIATEAQFDFATKRAYLPWRELSEEQAAQFDNLKGDGWTVFGHAEVKGATANGGHVAVGRVTQTQILAHSRAAYFAHYHKRQSLDAEQRIWYVGSPFEQNFGERDEPHGVAIITNESTVPTFVDFDDMPKHRRLAVGEPVAEVRKNDIVEVYALREEMDADTVRDYLATVPAGDVRLLPLKEDGAAKPPAFALSLDAAIEAYVADKKVEGIAPDDLISFGRAVLKDLPESVGIVPISPHVRIQSIGITNFCAVRGTVNVDLDALGLVLVKGPIGVGKTALMDALSWGLYGETAPRKAGSHGATIRADEVINDDADRCVVTVELMLGDEPVTVQREKKRGSGAKISVDGVAEIDGVKDTQDIIHRVLGLDYDLWRTCVSLGQGSVGNFITDADKRRKDLLSAPFGLNACPAAVEQVRSKLKAVNASYARTASDLSATTRVLETLRATDFTKQMEQWELTREANKDSLIKSGEISKATIAECEAKLVEEQSWVDRKAHLDKRVEELTAQLTALTGGTRLFELQRELGSGQAERGLAEQKHRQLSQEVSRMESEYAQSASMACPTCGQRMDTTHAEKHIAEKSHEATRYAHAMRTQDARIANVQVEIAQLQSNGSDQRVAINTELTEIRTELNQVGTALNALARLKQNKAEHERLLANARSAWAKEDKSRNPFAEEQSKIAANIGHNEEALVKQQASYEELGVQKNALEFWATGFGPKGIPVLVLRTVIHELELYANRFLSQLLRGRVYCKVSMVDEDIDVQLYERVGDDTHERRYEQLSGGQRRCVELAFAPFALSEMIFNRCGIRIPLLIVDELTTHLGADEKPIVCDILRALDRSTVIVIDHDASVQAEFDVVFEVGRNEAGTTFERQS